MKLTEGEAEIIELIREKCAVQWGKPYASVTDRGLYISVTEDDDADHSGYVSWKEFEDIMFWGEDSDDIEKRLAPLEKSVQGMKRRLARKKAKEAKP